MQIVGIVLFALLLLAVPIGIALSSAAAAYIMVDPLLEPTVIFRAFFSFIARYSLMAIPLFIFAGFLMERTGLIRQLFASPTRSSAGCRAASASQRCSPACCSARSPARASRWRRR